MHASMAPAIKPFSQAHRKALIAQLHAMFDKRKLEHTVKTHGKCSGQNTERWFAPYMTVRKTRNLCAGCPIQASCLQLAIVQDAEHVILTRRPLEPRPTLRLYGARGGLPAKSRNEPVIALLRRLGWERPVEVTV